MALDHISMIAFAAMTSSHGRCLLRQYRFVAVGHPWQVRLLCVVVCHWPDIQFLTHDLLGSHKSNLESPFTFERSLPHPPGRDEPMLKWEHLTELNALRDRYQVRLPRVVWSALGCGDSGMR
eukprot:COSAG02_NODE_567_length_20212_cov_18.927460_14_plen_122_part_00